jgi:hypothetical protein
MTNHQHMGKKPLGKLQGSHSTKALRTRINRAPRKDQVPDTTEPRYENDADGSFAWVAANAKALYEKYPDCWILVDNARVIESARDPEDLLRLALTLEIKEPFVTMTSPPERPGRSVTATGSPLENSTLA